MRDWDAFVRARLTLPTLTPAREAHIVRELATQLEDFYREALARGSTEAEADAYARQQVHDWDRMARDVSLADRAHARARLDQWSTALDDVAHRKRSGALKMMADVLHDARFAIRQFAKSPGFTIVAVVTLALGIGANTAIFSVVNGVLLRPMPFPQPEALVRVHEVVPQYGRFSVAPATFLDWRQQSTVFEHIAAYATGSTTFQGDVPERVINAAVSWDIFDLLRVAPAKGRGFLASEDAPGANRVIVLSHGMWERRFGSDPNILGRAFTLGRTPFTVVGVMPAGFYFPSRDVEYWMPIAINPANAPRGAHFLGVIARLKAGTSIEQAGVEMRTIAGRLAQQYEDNAEESAEIVGLHEQVVGHIRRPLMTLLAAVALVVLIACGNVANLLLVRASVREKEIAIRTALGAGRRRLVLQLLAESVLLSLLGGALGLVLAYAAIRPIQTLSAGSIPRVLDVAIDGTVLWFTFAIAVATGILFGLVPAWQASRPQLNEVLKEGGRSSAGSGGRWLRNALVMGEVALSLVLLVGASLLLRSFSRVTNVDPGFRTENVLAFTVSLPQASYNGRPPRMQFFDRLLERLHALPGVVAAGTVQSLPMRGDYFLSVAFRGRPVPPPNLQASANYRVVSPRYFDAMSMPLRRGRAFTDRDNVANAPMVAIVDEAFVARHFPGEDPIGQGLDIGNGTDGFFEIVGVVGDVRYEGLEVTATPTMYVPFSQDVFGTMWVTVRTDGPRPDMAAAARGAVRDLDRGLPAYSMTPLAEIVSDSVAQRRFSVLLLSLFALVALFLAAIGLYGVISYAVSLRTQEIGVRLAIGASQGHLLRMIIGQGMKLAVAGIALGVLGALALAQLITKLLFGGVTPFDVVSYAVTAVVLLFVAALACYVPARRAMRVDPLVALRAE